MDAMTTTEKLTLYRERVSESLRMMPVPDIGETRVAAVNDAIADFLKSLSDIEETIR